MVQRAHKKTQHFTAWFPRGAVRSGPLSCASGQFDGGESVDPARLARYRNAIATNRRRSAP